MYVNISAVSAKECKAIHRARRDTATLWTTTTLSKTPLGTLQTVICFIHTCTKSDFAKGSWPGKVRLMSGSTDLDIRCAYSF